MISRSDLKMIKSAARKEWMPDRDKRREYFDQVREVLNSPEAGERLVESALECEKLMQEAGWDLDFETVQ